MVNEVFSWNPCEMSHVFSYWTLDKGTVDGWSTDEVGGLFVLLMTLVSWAVEMWPKVLSEPVCPREEKLFVQSMLLDKLQALQSNQSFLRRPPGRAGTLGCKGTGPLHSCAFICSRLRAVVMATWALAAAAGRSYTHKGNASQLI